MYEKKCGEVGGVLGSLENIFDEDKMKADEDSVLPGLFQLLDIGSCLFGIYSLPSILNYLVWNQEVPLMIDATGLQIREWRAKKHWYVPLFPNRAYEMKSAGVMYG